MSDSIKIISAAVLGMVIALFACGAMADEPKNAEQESYRQAVNIVLQSLVKKGVLTQGQADMAMNEVQPTGTGTVYQAAKAIMQSLLKDGVWTQEQVDVVWSDLGLPAAEAAQQPDNAVRVPYIPEIVKDEIRERIKQDVLAQARQERWGDPGALPDWIARIKLEGDVRLRYQGDFFQSDNYPFIPNYLAINSAGDSSKTSTPFLNATEDRNRLRLRARLGVLATVADGVSVGMRLSTGSSTVPVSANYTLGNMNNRPPVLFDQAYVKADPLSWLTLIGGRMPNPWFSSDLVWADDLSFDGAAVLAKPRLLQDLSGFVTAGAFPLQEIELSNHDKWLYGAQIGAEWNPNRLRAKIGVAYYDYRNIAGIRNALNSHLLDYTAPLYLQKGNTLFNISQDSAKPEQYALAADYKDLDIAALLDFTAAGQVHVALAADAVKNIGFDRQEILSRTGLNVDKQIDGSLVKLSVGMAKLGERNDWQVYVGYKRVEADAVLDAFTDSDFHLGGTNAKGWIVGGGYGLTHNTSVSLRWLSADEVTGPPVSIDVGQVDLNVKF